MFYSVLEVVVGVIGIALNTWLLSNDDSRSPHAIGPKIYAGALIGSLMILSRGIAGLLGIPLPPNP